MTALLLAVGMSSCSKNEVYTNESSENAIQFSPYSESVAKGQVIQTIDIQEDGFGVLAYDQLGTTEFASLTTPLAPNFMYNTQVYDSSFISGTTTDATNASWTYSPMKYWSTDATNLYSFFGYAPFNGDGLALSSNTTTGAPTVTLTLQNPTEMVDFVAGQYLNTTKNGKNGATSIKTVNLNLKHQLTRVTFEGINGAPVGDPGVDSTYINVKSFKLLGQTPGTGYHTDYGSEGLYGKAVYTFNNTEDSNVNSEAHAADGTWSILTNKINNYNLTNYILNIVDPSTLTKGATGEVFEGLNYTEEGVLLQGGVTTATSLFKENEYLFLIPPAGPVGIPNANDIAGTSTASGGTAMAKANIQIEVIYDIVTYDSNLGEKYIVTSSDNLVILDLTARTLQQGHAYKFTLTFNGSSIMDPTDDPANPETGTGFDAVTLTGNVVEWDTSDETVNSLNF